MDDTATKVRGLQDQLDKALLAADGEGIAALVSPEARIVGPRGFLIDRAEWIEVHLSEDYQLTRLEVREGSVQAYGSTALVTDILDSACIYKGTDITGTYRVMQVWAYDDERWQLVGLQYTALQTS